jgi:hypothetical protein
MAPGRRRVAPGGLLERQSSLYRHVLNQDPTQVTLTEDKCVIQALLPGGSHPSVGDRYSQIGCVSGEQVKLLEVFVAVKLLIICVGDCIELGFFLRGQEFWEVGRRIAVDLDLS